MGYTASLTEILFGVAVYTTDSKLFNKVLNDTYIIYRNVAVYIDKQDAVENFRNT